MIGSNFIRIVPFLLSAFVHRAHSLDYSDLETLGAACSNPTTQEVPPDSCAGYTYNQNYLDRNCECDSACTAFKDCCINAVQRRPNSRPRQSIRATCMHYGVHKYTGVYMITTCSNSWSGSLEVREKCQGPTNFSDPLHAAPVTTVGQGTRLGTTYKNRFCAECNNAVLETLKTFQVKLNCEGLSFLSLTDEQIMADLEYDEQFDIWGVRRLNSFGNSTAFYGCDIIFDVPHYLNSSVRFCRSNLISSCPPNYRRPMITRACNEYMAVVYDNLDAYRNPHCAICNGKTVSKISCTNYEWIGGRKRPMSFALLLDVNQSDGDQVGLTQETTPECPANNKYDPFFKKCRRLVCALPGHVVVDGKCVRE